MPNGVSIKDGRCLIYILMTGIVALLALTARWVDSPKSRYQIYPDQYGMIFRQAGGVDLAAMGSSRMLTMFDGHLMADLLEARLGRPTVVYDLAKPWRGNGLAFAILRDLMENRPVRHLLVEFNATGPAVNVNFPVTARYWDIVESSLINSSQPPWARMQSMIRMNVKKTAHQLSRVLSGQRRPLGDVPTEQARTTDPTPPHPVSSSLVTAMIREYAQGWESRPDRAWDLYSPAERRNVFYLFSLTALARSHGTSVTFVHLPVLYETPLFPGFIHMVEQKFGVRLLCLSREELAEIYPKGYADDQHLNTFGSAFYMNWLARNLELE